MRLPPFPTGRLPGVFTAETPEAASAGHVHELLGAWSATRWQYAAADGGRRVDVICDLAGMITLSISPGTWVLSFVVPRWGARSVGGTWTEDAGILRLAPLGAPVIGDLRFRVSGEVLSLSSDQSEWSFRDEGPAEPATLQAVFVRL